MTIDGHSGIGHEHKSGLHAPIVIGNPCDLNVAVVRNHLDAASQ